jgi:hypothetical protein
MPEYQAFRTADKALKALLKEEKKDLKSLEAESTTLPPIKLALLNKFHDARDAYFRAKTAVLPSSNSTAIIAQSGSPPTSHSSAETKTPEPGKS